jgi:hypothetical protein
MPALHRCDFHSLSSPSSSRRCGGRLQTAGAARCWNLGADETFASFFRMASAPCVCPLIFSQSCCPVPLARYGKSSTNQNSSRTGQDHSMHPVVLVSLPARTSDHSPSRALSHASRVQVENTNSAHQRARTREWAQTLIKIPPLLKSEHVYCLISHWSGWSDGIGSTSFTLEWEFHDFFSLFFSCGRYI